MPIRNESALNCGNRSSKPETLTASSAVVPTGIRNDTNACSSGRAQTTSIPIIPAVASLMPPIMP